MDNVKAEIERIETALRKTKSPMLKRDYEKHLARLMKNERKKKLYNDKAG